MLFSLMLDVILFYVDYSELATFGFTHIFCHFLFQCWDIDYQKFCARFKYSSVANYTLTKVFSSFPKTHFEQFKEGLCCTRAITLHKMFDN